MHFSRFLPVIAATFSVASAQLLTIPLLDIGLLQDGALINVGLFANLLGENSCPNANVAGVVNVLGLLRVCACVNVLNPGIGQQACPACPTNSIPVCGASKCACQCRDGFYASSLGTCVPETNCAAPNVLTISGTTGVCTCAPGYGSNGAGGCVLSPSARSRAARHRRAFGARLEQEVLAPAPSEPKKAKMTCPDGETACPLASGGFECVDTATSLDSCGGCIGEGGEGQNCLAIPGALAVQCHESTCHVGSCFRGWRHIADGNGACV